MSAWYFGCWDQPGHYLWHTDGTHPRKERPSPLGDSMLPDLRGMDGGFAPKRRPDGSIFGNMVQRPNITPVMVRDTDTMDDSEHRERLLAQWLKESEKTWDARARRRRVVAGLRYAGWTGLGTVTAETGIVVGSTTLGAVTAGTDSDPSPTTLGAATAETGSGSATNASTARAAP